MEPLSWEELEEIRAFFNNSTGQKLMAQLQEVWIADWMASDTPEQREECWRMLQASQRLETLLKDAEANKRLTERARARLQI